MDRIDDDREHIRVVDDALFDTVPSHAAVGRLPRQMPGSGIDDLWIGGIDRDRFHLVDLRAVCRTDELPMLAAVLGAIDPGQGSHDPYLRIGGRLRHRADRLATHVWLARPGDSAILADEQTAIVAIDHPA